MEVATEDGDDGGAVVVPVTERTAGELITAEDRRVMEEDEFVEGAARCACELYRRTKPRAGLTIWLGFLVDQHLNANKAKLLEPRAL